MKRIYEAPVAEKIRFQYAEQVAASTGDLNETDSSWGDQVTQYLSQITTTCVTKDQIHQFCSSLFDLF